MLKRRCTVFLLSDFYDRQDFLKQLQIANRKHDMIAIQVYDKRAKTLPDVGLMKVCDAETGHEMIIDTSSKKLRQRSEEHTSELQSRQYLVCRLLLEKKKK